METQPSRTTVKAGTRSCGKGNCAKKEGGVIKYGYKKDADGRMAGRRPRSL